MSEEARVNAARDGVSIAALVGETVALEERGPSLRGKCPIGACGGDLYVHPARQMFHCFTCKRVGDAFSWVMRRDSVPFPKAIETLETMARQRHASIAALGRLVAEALRVGDHDTAERLMRERSAL